MAIRRLQYQIDCTHILTFRDEYRHLVYPYFTFDGIEYAIDNENTIHESIRLIYKKERVAFVLRKEGVILLYEGDVAELKNPNGMIRIFWELFEKFKGLKNYTKASRHVLTIHAVTIQDKETVDEFLKQNKYILNPIGPLDEVSCIYEFKKDDIFYNFQFGNYNDGDIKKHDLTPFKSEFNNDLPGAYGLIGRLEMIEAEKQPGPNKFKQFLKIAEEFLGNFELTK